jgi:type II restriction enzyme
MKRQQLIHLINHLANAPHAFDELEQAIATFSGDTLKSALWDCGIIPESFAPSSSQEKLWAKYCDILFALSLNQLGLDAEVIRTRGDSADVLAKANGYSLVGDAKAFRLSRTAKNQKDFKITALDDWRKSNTYACLVGPLIQFPSQTSQIYQQASQRNVTLISYTHLAFLMEYPPNSLMSLWQLAGHLSPSQQASSYWTALERELLKLTDQSEATLEAYKKTVTVSTLALAQEGLDYWQAVADGYQTLSHQEAIERLLKAEKIDQKIAEIHKLMARIEQNDGTIS